MVEREGGGKRLARVGGFGEGREGLEEAGEVV